jgi:hypothetical protein
MAALWSVWSARDALLRPERLLPAGSSRGAALRCFTAVLRSIAVLGLSVPEEGFVNGLSMVGVTHRGAPLPLLERMSVPRGDRSRFLTAVHDAGYPEAVVLSTCSRTEIYVRPAAGEAAGLLAVLAGHAGSTPVDLQAAAETRTGQTVVEHLFRVAAGLDSRVIGEVEIYGQAGAHSAKPRRRE